MDRAAGDLDVGAFGQAGGDRYRPHLAAPGQVDDPDDVLPGPVLQHGGDGNGEGVVDLLVDDVDGHLRTVGPAEVGHLDAALVDLRGLPTRTGRHCRGAVELDDGPGALCALAGDLHRAVLPDLQLGPVG